MPRWSKRRVLLCVLAAAVFVVGWKGARAAYAVYAEFRKPPRGAPARPHMEHLIDVAFQRKDGATLRGWGFPSRNGAAVLLLHGSPSERTQMLPEAFALYHAGFGALVIDLPGYGESEGKIDWTPASADAVEAAITAMARLPGVEPSRLGAYGFSMSTLALTNEVPRDPRIAAVALSGTLVDYDHALAFEQGHWGPITAWPARAMARLLLDVPHMHAGDVSAISPRPVLFIHGSADAEVPLWMPRQLFAQAREPKELWIIPGGWHGDYQEVAGQAYFDRLISFFSQHLLAHTPPVADAPREPAGTSTPR